MIVSSRGKRTASSIHLPPGASVPCRSFSPGAPGDARTRRLGRQLIAMVITGLLLSWNLAVAVF